MEETTTASANKVQVLLDEAYACRTNNIQNSINLANQALEISKDLENTQCIAKSLCDLSLFHMMVGDFDLAINMAEEAIEHFEELEDEKGIADAKYNIAGALYKTDNYNLGLAYLTDCLFTYKKFEDYHNLARVQKSMGTIYEYFGDTNSAISYFEESIKSGEKVDDKILQSNAFNPLSGIYLSQGKTKEALDLIEKSIEWKSESNDIRGLAFAFYGRGKVFTATGDFTLAEKDFLDAIKIHDQMGEKLGKAMCYHKLGALYVKMNRLEDAKEILVRALQYSNKNRIILIKFKANYLLHEIAKKEENYKLAVKYLTQYIQEKESVINDKTAKVIESYEVVAKMQTLETEAIRQKEKVELIEEKNLELDSFFYRISHDLKGPLTAMSSLQQVAQREIKEEAALFYFREFAKQAERINNILDSMMQLTKLTYNSEDMDEVDLEKITYDCINSYKHLPNFDKVKFTVYVEDDVSFRAEWGLMNTIIQNLIENSIKYARFEDNHPWVAITIYPQNDELVILVEDNGIGMTEDTQSKIFKMFFRVDKKIEGTGLGLHILKRAVDKLKGTIDITSELDKGSAFKIYLPFN